MIVSVRAAVLILLAAAPIAESAPTRRHNVLLIVSDDLRPDFGCYGGRAITPNLDKLAGSAGTVLFERAYVQQAICCPTRSSFLTGRRPDTTRVWDLKTQFRVAGESWKTLPQFFKEQGYWSAGMGKVFHPVKYEGKTDDVAGGSWSAPYFHAHGEDNTHPLRQTNCGVADSDNTDEDYSDGKIAAHAVETLRNASAAAASGKKPFFVAVGFHRPHLPWVVPKKYFDLYPVESIDLADHNKPPQFYNVTGAQPFSWDPQSGPRHCAPLVSSQLPEYGLVDDDTARHFRRSYWAAVSQTDRNVGVVLDELEQLGHTNNTVVAFIGDHGWQLGDLGEFGKKTNFERATRAPMIIRDPTRTSSGVQAAKSAAIVEFVDLMPTIMHLALGPEAIPPLCPKHSANISLCTEGQSLDPIMEDPLGTKDLRPAAFMQYATCMHDEGIWHDACKAADQPTTMGYALRTRRWRYIEWVRFNKSTDPPTPYWDKVLGTELYDHTQKDSVENAAESVNLVGQAQYKSIVSKLSKQLHEGWRAARVEDITHWI